MSAEHAEHAGGQCASSGCLQRPWTKESDHDDVEEDNGMGREPRLQCSAAPTHAS